MKKLALLMLALTACAPAPTPAPDLITRPAPTPGVIDPAPSTSMGNIDAPSKDLDGSAHFDPDCCAVAFAVPAADLELEATLVFGAQRFAMSRPDGGAWLVTACVPFSPRDYFFEVGLPTDDDAGVFIDARVNTAVPTSNASTLAPVVNRFEIGDAGTCAGFDATAYAALPDAG